MNYIYTKKVEARKLPLVIFADHKRYWNLYEPICDELERREIESFYWTASPDDPALEKDYKFVKCEFIGEGNKAFARLNMMKAKICFSTTPGLDVYQWKRSKECDYYVHIHHATEEGTGYRMFGMDFFDAILCSGQTQVDYLRKLEAVRNIPEKEAKVVGCTYMDSLLERYEARKKEAFASEENKDYTALSALMSDHISKGESDSSSYFFKGTDRLVGYCPVAGTTWSVVVAVEKSEISAQINLIQNILIAIIVGAILIGAVITFFVSNSIALFISLSS